MKGKDKKINLIYILGAGHSGSTLLSLLLNNHSNIISVGELRNCPPINGDKNERCFCGSNFSDCSFWKKVKERFIKNLKKEGKELKENNLKNLSIKYNIKGILNYKDPYFYHLKDKKYYEQGNAFLFKSILEESGVEWAVDSSKSPHRLAYLYNSKYFDIKVIYLYRDGRAFINSLKKHNLPNYKAVISWLIQNIKSQKCIEAKINKNDIKKIKYEELTRKPDRILKNVCNFVGIKFDKNILNLEKIRKEKQHLIGGNPRIKNNLDKISPHSNWKRKINLMDRLIFMIVGGKINKKLNYPIFKILKDEE